MPDTDSIGEVRAGGATGGVRQVTVGADEADQRLDRWLRRRFPQVNQGRIERMCRKGEIRVDGGRVRPATRLEAGQVVLDNNRFRPTALLEAVQRLLG